MKCPTKEQVLKAATAGRDIKIALKELFPEVFLGPIHPGELYSWGTDSDGACGVVIDIGMHFAFVNFLTGFPYIAKLPKTSTKEDLNHLLSQKSDQTLCSCYRGEIRGPKRFRSWCTK